MKTNFQITMTYLSSCESLLKHFGEDKRKYFKFWVSENKRNVFVEITGAAGVYGLPIGIACLDFNNFTNSPPNKIAVRIINEISNQL